MPSGLLEIRPRRPIVTAGLLFLALAVPVRVRAQSPALPCPGNRLVNPGFEQGFAARGTVNRTVAHGWLDWHDRAATPPQLLPLSRARDGEAAVRAGAWSQAVRDLGRLQAGGLWQRIPVPSGERVSAHAWGRASFGRYGDFRDSEPAGSYLLTIGIDPRGGSDPAADGIAWTTPITFTDTWLPFFVETTAEASAVSLFLRGQPLDERSNEARWDEVCVRLADEPLPPVPTSTASPPPTRELEDGQPSATPDLATLEAHARTQARATGRAIDLQHRATEWAATPPALRQPRPVLGSGVTTGFSPSGAFPSTPTETSPARAPWWARVYDHAGLVALALAALAAGILTGLGRADRGARP